MNTKTYNSLEQQSPLTMTNIPSNHRCSKRTLLYTIIITGILFLALLIFTIVYVVDNESSSDSTADNFCTTKECIKVSEELLSYIDDTVNPCFDFFHYACGGFAKQFEFELAKPGENQYRPKHNMGKWHRDIFLGAIFNQDSATDLNQSSIEKVSDFYNSCYQSDINKEQIQINALLNEFISKVNFTQSTDINSNWTQNEILAFNTALKWLLQRGWNLLFYLNVFAEQMPAIYQNYDVWVFYEKSNWIQMMDDTFKPSFVTLFPFLNETKINSITDLIINFTESVANITTSDPNYFNWDLVYKTSEMNYYNIDNIFDSGNIMNYSQIVMETFEVENVNTEIEKIIYVEQDIDFFKNLTTLITNTNPVIIQYFLYTNVLFYFQIYSDSISQPRTIDRRDFCYALTRDNFGYIFAYIIDEQIYGIETQNKIEEISYYILETGLLPLLESTSWLDEASRHKAREKALNMNIYIGLPQQMRNISLINQFYENVVINNSQHNFVSNYETMLNFKQKEMVARFKDDITVDLITPSWPAMFRNTESGIHWLPESGWLTQITAFYNPQMVGNDKGNFFCIPQLISSSPYFDINYPSAINFGGLGAVIGHEISHGFDPWGSMFNWNGTLIEEWTNETRTKYNKRMDCFINQYDNIHVNGINETGNDALYVNGTNSITGNSADNAGIQEAYLAWKEYINEHNDHIDGVQLPGIELNNEQLFWIGFTRTRCDVWTKSFYDDKITTEGDYYWNHSPEMARAVGVIQNSEAFANAFNCPVGSAMNPQNKCILWE